MNYKVTVKYINGVKQGFYSTGLWWALKMVNDFAQLNSVKGVKLTWL